MVIILIMRVRKTAVLLLYVFLTTKVEVSFCPVLRCGSVLRSIVLFEGAQHLLSGPGNSSIIIDECGEICISFFVLVFGATAPSGAGPPHSRDF